MGILPANPPAPPRLYKVIDLVTDALIEIGAVAPGEPAGNDEGQWAFRKLNYLLDTWATRKNFVYCDTFLTYTLVPNLVVATIGPSGFATYPAAQRPTKIVRATVILNNSNPPVEVNLNIRDSAWWMEDVSIKALTSQQPTDLFYSPSFPDGSMYIWPVPTQAYGLRLQCWALLAQFASIQDDIGGPGTKVNVPPGYRNAMMLSLAETLQPGQDRPANPVLSMNAAAARAGVFNLNSASPRMGTKDSGAPGATEDRSQTYFSWRSRSY